MAEYIERDSIYSRVKTETNPYGKPTLDYESGVKVLDMIKQEPAADVAHVVHAEWEFRNDGRYGQTRCYCSACGKHSGIGGIRENQMKPFCPNCGARMNGGKHG